MTKEVKLYDEFTEEEFKALLSVSATEAEIIFNKLEIIETSIANAIGNFVTIDNYWFKKVYSYYQCLATPSEQHEMRIVFSPKAAGDRGRGFYQRYRSKTGGKEEFNPTTGTGNPGGKKTL